MHKYRCLLVLSLILVYVNCQEDDHDHEGDHPEDLLSTSQIWGFGFLAGLGISLIGFFAALILLTAKKCCSDKVFGIIVKFLFSLACGALLGDAIVHILAQAYSNQDLQSLIVSLIFIVSILVLVMIEKVMESCGFSHTHWHQQSQEHSHNQNNPEEGLKMNLEEIKIKSNSSSKKNVLQSNQNIHQKQKQGQKIEDEEGEKNWCIKFCKQYSGKGTMGYMNLIGSLIHNFIDGLALGISFSSGNTTEIVPVVVAIIAHEIPRELGDVAILLKNNFSEIQTVVCNGTINFFSLIGVIIGLAATNLNDSAKGYIMIFVAANFIYVAADIWKHMFQNKECHAKLKNILEFGGFSIGVGAMFALTLLESQEGHQH